MSSSKSASEQDLKEDKDLGEDHLEILWVPVTDRRDAISIKIVTTFNIFVFDVNDYHQTYLFVRIRQIEDPNTPLCDICLT